MTASADQPLPLTMTLKSLQKHMINPLTFFFYKIAMEYI